MLDVVPVRAQTRVLTAMAVRDSPSVHAQTPCLCPQPRVREESAPGPPRLYLHSAPGPTRPRPATPVCASFHMFVSDAVASLPAGTRVHTRAPAVISLWRPSSRVRPHPYINPIAPLH
jgi:hypothetical protein